MVMSPSSGRSWADRNVPAAECAIQIPQVEQTYVISEFKEFPPGLGHIKVPLASRRAAQAALSLYAPCRPAAVWMHRSSLILLRIFGARALPTRTVRWHPPMPHAEWEEIRAQLARYVGSFDGIAVGERTQAERSGFAMLLLKGGKPVAFVKLRRGDPEALRREFEVMSNVERAAPRTFLIPAPVGMGHVGDWCFSVMEPLPSAAHRVPRKPPLEEIVSELQAALSPLAREPAPSHWQPMHGDFTPWNLRALPGGALVLFDWEDAAWAPPGADVVLYRASASAIGLEELSATADAEVADFWADRIRGRAAASGRDGGLGHALLRNLEAMKMGSAAAPHAVAP